MALVSGDIFVCPRVIANETAPIITVEIPRAVNGVEFITRKAVAASKVPINAKLVESVVYAFLNGKACQPQVI